MSTKQARGTKRTCQNSECGSRFYDLNRSPIVCPICQSQYVIASAPMSIADHQSDVVSPNKEFTDTSAVTPDDAPEAEAEALADIEPAEEAGADEADETFLEEEEEDGGDVSGIIGGVSEDEDEA